MEHCDKRLLERRRHFLAAGIQHSRRHDEDPIRETARPPGGRIWSPDASRPSGTNCLAFGDQLEGRDLIAQNQRDRGTYSRPYETGLWVRAPLVPSLGCRPNVLFGLFDGAFSTRSNALISFHVRYAHCVSGKHDPAVIRCFAESRTKLAANVFRPRELLRGFGELNQLWR